MKLYLEKIHVFTFYTTYCMVPPPVSVNCNNVFTGLLCGILKLFTYFSGSFKNNFDSIRFKTVNSNL